MCFWLHEIFQRWKWHQGPSQGKDSLGQRLHLHLRSHGSPSDLSAMERSVLIILHSISCPLRLAKALVCMCMNGQRAVLGRANHFHSFEKRLNEYFLNSHVKGTASLSTLTLPLAEVFKNPTVGCP